MKIHGKTLTVPVGEIRENTWNPNRMTDEQFAATSTAIDRFGQVAPIIVREVKGKVPYEIVDGTHRHRYAMENDAAEVLVHNLGAIDDQTAKRLTIVFGRNRGEFDPFAYGALLDSLRSEGLELDDLAEEVADEGETLESLADSLDYDWELAVRPEVGGPGFQSTMVFTVPYERRPAVEAVLDRYTGDRSEQFLSLIAAVSQEEGPDATQSVTSGPKEAEGSES